MYEILKGFIKPELFILIPVIYIIGASLKKAATFPDKFIPVVLGIISIGLTLCYIAATMPILDMQSSALWLFTGCTQGVLIAGASVYIDQLIKQSDKKE